MKSIPSKTTLAVVLMLPLLVAIGLVLRVSSSPRVVSPAAPPTSTAPAKIIDRKLTAMPAIQSLKQDGSFDSLQAALRAVQRQAVPVRHAPLDVADAKYTMAAPWRGVRAYFGTDKVQVRAAGTGRATWSWDTHPVSYGYSGAPQLIERAEPVALNNSVEYHRGALTEWYLNDDRGLEQGFTLATRPAAREPNHGTAGPLTLTIAITSDLTPRVNEAADSVTYTDAKSGDVLNYAGLLAWDADGKRLPAHLELRAGGELAMLVDDRTANYPLTIDPIIYIETKLTAPDGIPYDALGSSVSINGDTVVVGAPARAPEPGAAYVFARSGATWTFEQKLEASDGVAGDLFGASVAMSADTIVVGAFQNGYSGSAYVYVRNLNHTWTQQGSKLTANDASAEANFGYAVTISGETIVVGAYADGGAVGAAFVFVRNGTTWSRQGGKLTCVDGPSVFGRSVALDGDTLVVGADLDGSGFYYGAAYILTRANGIWSQVQKLTADIRVTNAAFGLSVAISGDTVAVGAPATKYEHGAVFVFVRSGNTWVQQGVVAGPLMPMGRFGYSVALSGDTLVVGRPGYSGDALGAVYLFGRTGGAWTQTYVASPSDGQQGNYFGEAVAIDGDSIAVGAPEGGFLGGSPGSAYIYDNQTAADLLVSQSANKTSVKSGDLLTYTITVRNFGPNRAINVAVDDTLPSGTTFSSARANKGHFTTPPSGQTGVVTWYLGDMLSGAQDDAQLVVTVAIKGKGTLTNVAAVRSATFDPNSANNTATLATTVGAGTSNKK